MRECIIALVEERFCTRRRGDAKEFRPMKAIADFARLVWLLMVAGVRTWWTFRGERGVEPDDPDKERER